MKMCVDNLKRVWKSGGGDEEARGQMSLAATYAGVGFGNAGEFWVGGIGAVI